MATFNSYIRWDTFKGVWAQNLLIMPEWTTAGRPSGADLFSNSIGVNTDVLGTPTIEWYNGVDWVQLVNLPETDPIFTSSFVSNITSIGSGLSLSGGVLSATVSAYTDEQAQDAVGAALTNSASVQFVYNDVSNSITATVVDSYIRNLFSAGSGISYDTISGQISAPVSTLQQVTTAGNTTSQSIIIANTGGLYVTKNGDTQLRLGTWTDGVNYGGAIELFELAPSGTANRGTLKTTTLAVDRTWVFPDATGTVALVSDIPTPYSLPIASTTVLGGVKVDGTTITIDGSGVISSSPGYTDAMARAAISLNTAGTSGAATYNSTTGVFNIPNYTYTLPTASTSTLGGVKVDGTTITITGGVISAAGGSDTNFASSNLSFTADRSHELNGHTLSLTNSASPIFKVHPTGQIEAGDTVSNSLFIGFNSGLNNTPGVSPQGHWNVGFGEKSLWNVTTGNDNLGFGYGTGMSITTAYHTISIGTGANQALVNGHDEIVIGIDARSVSISTANNIAIGTYAQQNNNGSNNTSVGYQSLKGTSIGTGSYNVALGMYSGISTTDASANVSVGYESLRGQTTGGSIGGFNVALGIWAGYSTNHGRSVFLGPESGYYSDEDNAFYVHNTSTGITNEADGKAKSMFYGKFVSTGENILRMNGSMGINLSPTARLHLPAGTATANTAPLKLTSGTALTTPEDGSLEYHSSHLYFTIGSTRYQLDQQGGGGSVTPAALTKTDDTNVTLSLGGSPATALLQATSLTLGWSGQLSLARGGTGASLSSPGANTLMGWDNTDGAVKFLTIGSGLSYDHTSHTLSATGGGGGGISGLTTGYVPYATSATTIANGGLFWDNTNGYLGLGTTAPVCNFHIKNTTGPAYMLFESTPNGGYAQFELRNTQGTASLQLYSDNTGGGNYILSANTSSGNKKLTFAGFNSGQGSILVFDFATIKATNLATGGTAPTTSGTTKMVITDANGQFSFADIPGSSTPGIDTVLAVGQSLSADRTIGGAFNFGVSAGSMSIGSSATAGAAKLYVNQTSTGLGAYFRKDGFPTTGENSFAVDGQRIVGNGTFSGSNSVVGLYGELGFNSGDFVGSGPAYTGYNGINGVVTIYPGGGSLTANNSMFAGGQYNIFLSGSGTVNKFACIRTLYPVLVPGQSFTGTITNHYGLYIDDTTLSTNTANITNRWGIYQAGGSDRNVFGATLNKFGSTSDPTSAVDITGGAGYNQLRLRNSFTPTSSSDSSGNTGDHAWDDNYVYVKTSTGWKRAALSTF